MSFGSFLRGCFAGNNQHSVVSPFVPLEILSGEGELAASAEEPPKSIFRADSRLSLARRNVPGIYKGFAPKKLPVSNILDEPSGDTEDCQKWDCQKCDKIIFKLWSVCDLKTENQMVFIFPISLYSAEEELIKKIGRGDLSPYFHRSILWGKWDPSRVPEVCRVELEFWLPYILRSVAHYDNRAELRNRRQ